MVQFLVALHLFGGKVGKVVAGQTADEKRAVDDVIVAQHTVQRQVFCNAVIVTDDTGAIPPRVHCLDGAADNCLLGFKGVLNVGFAGYSFRVQRSELSSASSSSEVSFSAFFCLTVSSTIPVADARDTTTIASNGKPSPVCGRVCTLCGVITGVGAGVGAGVAAGVGCGVGAGVVVGVSPRGAWLHRSFESGVCRRAPIRHPHFRGRTEKSRHQRFPT